MIGAVPLLEEMRGGPSSAMIAGLAGLTDRPFDRSLTEEMENKRPPRQLTVYPASAGFELVEELDHLCARTIEPNVFFNPRFLAPAMPRLEDREVRLAVIRDGDADRTRLRLLFPFSVERPSVPLGTPVMRTWSSPFGPLGTPLIDRDDPVGVIEDLFEMLSRPRLKLPRVLVLPEIPLAGPVSGIVRSVALANGLPLVIGERVERPVLESSEEPEAYLRNALRSHHFREFRRLRRRLGEHGEVRYAVARQPGEIREQAEAFLALEASGWKGRERTAMAIDRYRAAFAREAIDRLSQQDMCRIHTLSIGDRLIASLIVFIEAGVAYTWKTAYDEAFESYSPGTLLAIDATRTLLDDPNVMIADSCAVPDHPVMSRIWSERREIGTLVIGLTPGTDRLVRQAAAQLHLYKRTINMARLMRNRIRSLLGRN